MRELIRSGINVNVTLIFSVDRYQEVMEAYIPGLEDRLSSGQSVAGIASVASFFVSRVDVAVDARLDAMVADNPAQHRPIPFASGQNGDRQCQDRLS